MSRRNKPRLHGTPRNLAWPIIAFGVILVAGAALLLTRPAGGSAGGTPRIAVDQQRVDYGYVKLGETRTINIAVTNTGDGTLRFKEQPYIEVLEGCCPPDLTIGSMVLGPGQSTTIRSQPFMMHEGMDGPHNFGIRLSTNDPAQPQLMVNVISDWGP